MPHPFTCFCSNLLAASVLTLFLVLLPPTMQFLSLPPLMLPLLMQGIRCTVQIGFSIPIINLPAWQVNSTHLKPHVHQPVLNLRLHLWWSPILSVFIDDFLFTSPRDFTFTAASCSHSWEDFVPTTYFQLHLKMGSIYVANLQVCCITTAFANGLSYSTGIPSSPFTYVSSHTSLTVTPVPRLFRQACLKSPAHQCYNTWVVSSSPVAQPLCHLSKVSSSSVQQLSKFQSHILKKTFKYNKIKPLLLSWPSLWISLPGWPV